MIVVQLTRKSDLINVDSARVTKLVKAICSRFKLTKAVINIAMVGDDEIRILNKQFLGHDWPTDCLSFDLSDDENKKSFELVVNTEKAVTQANLRGHLPEAESALYITHGLLHNLGFDDSEPDQAKKMHETEDEILQQAGYGLVYNRDSDDQNEQ